MLGPLWIHLLGLSMRSSTRWYTTTVLALPFLLSGMGQAAGLNALPDKAFDYPWTAGVTALGLSADGRVLAALSGSSLVVMDAHSARSLADAEGETFSSAVTVSDCTPSDVYVSGSSSQYIVNLICADTDSGLVLNQYTVTTSSDTETSQQLDLETTPVQTAIDSSLTSLTASTYEPTSETLYVAASGTSAGAVLAIDVSSASEDPTVTDFAILTSLTPTLLSYVSSSLLLLTDSAGMVYRVGQDSTVTTTTVTGLTAQCDGATTPRALLALSSSTAILLGGESEEIYVVSIASELLTSCTAYDWGLTGKSYALATLTGPSETYLMVRGNTTTGNLAAFQVDSILSNPATVSPETTSPGTVSTPTSNDILVTDPYGRVFLGSSATLTELNSGPTLTVNDSLSEPIVVTTSDGVFELTLGFDEPVANLERVWFDIESPGKSSTSSTPELELSETSQELDTSNLTDGLSEGLNTLYIYAQDVDGNLGWLALKVNLVEPPASLENVELLFGDGKLFISFTDPADDAVTGYEILIGAPSDVADGSFTVDSSASLPTGWTSSSPNFTVSDVAYPGTDGWPLALEATTDTTVWSETDGKLVYNLSPLNNDTTYYVAIRAISSGVGGAWSAVLSQMPEETCGAVCVADDAGGFCSLASVRPDAQGQAWPMWLLAGVAALRIRSRRRR